MKRVLLDTNVILDIALMREPHYALAVAIFERIDAQGIEASMTASSVTDIYYIAKKEKGHADAIGFVRGLIQVVHVLGVDRDIIEMALDSEMKDFEDAVQASAASVQGISMVITRNKDDFATSGLDVHTPKEFLSLP
jgi:predicted nucleic acid-binding protein